MYKRNKKKQYYFIQIILTSWFLLITCNFLFFLALINLVVKLYLGQVWTF